MVDKATNTRPTVGRRANNLNFRDQVWLDLDFLPRARPALGRAHGGVGHHPKGGSARLGAPRHCSTGGMWGHKAAHADQLYSGKSIKINQVQSRPVQNGVGRLRRVLVTASRPT